MNTKENVLSKLTTGLKHERLAYKIYGIVSLVLAIILIIFGALVMISDVNAVTNRIISAHLTLGTAYISLDNNLLLLGYGCIVLAIAIVNLVRASRIGKYRIDETLTIKQTSSVSSIVMPAIFNDVALVFAIINFVNAKKNSEVLNA